MNVKLNNRLTCMDGTDRKTTIDLLDKHSINGRAVSIFIRELYLCGTWRLQRDITMMNRSE